MHVDVYSRHDAYVGTIGSRQLLAFVWTDTLNGEDSVDITTTFQLREGYRLVWRDLNGTPHEHVCQDPKGASAAGLPIYTDTALNSICELFGDYIEDKRPYSYSFQRALETCLEPTRWEVGTVDKTGTVSSGLTFYHTDCRSALNAILECGGELETSIEVGASGVTHRRVSIRQHRGDSNGHRRFSYGKDINSISRTEHWGAITACYGYGKGVETDSGGYGRKLTFGDINGGKDYVEDSTALETYGRPDGEGGFAHVFGKYENTSCEDPHQLLQETNDYLDQHKVPGVTYEADVIDLVAMGRPWEGVGVGDDTQMVDGSFEPTLRCQGRVSKLVTDMLGKTQTVTLGNVTESIADILQQQQQQITNLQNQSGSWDAVATTSPAFLQQLIDSLNEQFNMNGMSYMHLSYQNGFIFSSVPLDEDGRPTSTGGTAMQLCALGFRIADGTKADGSYDWRTFGTGAGFVADWITTGTLLANLIKAGRLVVGDEDDPVFVADFDEKTVMLNASCVYIGAKSAEQKFSEIDDGLGEAKAVYGYCTTAASVADKTVDIENFKLRDGATVAVRFLNENTAASPRLNVSGTGAKYIMLNNVVLGSKNYWKAQEVLTFVYASGYWRIADSGSHSLIKATEDAINLEVEGVKDDLSTTKASIEVLKDDIEISVGELQDDIDSVSDRTTKYGTCSTAGATQDKTVSVSGDFALTAGVMVSVYFSYANTAANPRLNVNGTGAKYIYVGSSLMSSDYYWRAGTTVQFVYTGSSWRVCDSGALAKIKVAEDEIELKVSKGSVSSQISVETGQVSIESNRFSWDSNYSSMSRYGVLTCQSITAKGTFRCGYSDDDYLQMNSSGQLAGYKDGAQIGYIDYRSAVTWIPTGETKYGMQLYGKEHIRMSTPIFSTAASSSTSTTTTSGSTGRIWLAGFTSDPGSWRLEDLVLMECRFINGICVRSMNS